MRTMKYKFSDITASYTTEKRRNTSQGKNIQ